MTLSTWGARIVREVLEALKAGPIRAEDVVEHYRREDWGRVPEGSIDEALAWLGKSDRVKLLTSPHLAYELRRERS